MRVSSYTDLILMKLMRTKEIEDNMGHTEVSEGIDANYQDMINYAVFGLIKLAEAARTNDWYAWTEQRRGTRMDRAGGRQPLDACCGLDAEGLDRFAVHNVRPCQGDWPLGIHLQDRGLPRRMGPLPAKVAGSDGRVAYLRIWVCLRLHAGRRLL